MTRPSAAPRNGFTLLELLVALVVLGFVLAGLGQGVRFGLKAWGMQSRRVAQQSDMDASFRVLRRVIEQADPGEANQNGTFQGGAHTLSILSRLPLAAASAGVLDADMGIGVDSRHRLVLRSTPHPHAERLGPAPPARESVLLDAVDHVDFSYFRVGGKVPVWVTSWSAAEPPALVRLHVAFTKEEKRRWPDLVVAPVRARIDE